MPDMFYGFGDGNRVRHRDWGSTGTVRFHYEDDPQADPIVPEVIWDDSFVDFELTEALAANLVRI